MVKTLPGVLEWLIYSFKVDIMQMDSPWGPGLHH